MPKPLPSAQPSQSPPTEDRRQAVRYSSTQEGSCRTPTSNETTAVKIRDISRRGIGLLASRRFEVGTTLVINIGEAETNPVTLFARVARLARQPDGQWLAGCALVGDLSDDELRIIRADGSGAVPLERRAGVRISQGTIASCRLDTPGSLRRWPAEVTDLSELGIGLLSPCAVEEGTRLRIVLPGEGEGPRVVLARVVRQDQKPEGSWLLGCEIARPANGKPAEKADAGKQPTATRSRTR